MPIGFLWDGPLWNFYDFSMGFLCDFSGISMESLLDFYDISMGLLLDFQWIPIAFLWNFHDVSMIFP